MTQPSAPTTARRTGRRGRRLAALIVVVVILAIAAYLVVGVLVYDRLSEIVSHCMRDYATNTPAAFSVEGVATMGWAMPQYETVDLPSRDPNVDIKAWYVPAPTGAGDSPAVVLVHGHESCRREGKMLLAAGMLHKAGMAVLLVDLRNHGDSTVVNGRYAAGTREYRDVLGGWDWLVAQGHPAARTGILGMSLGAATALIATGEEPRVAAVWEDSSYADTDEAIQAELTRNGFPTFIRFGGYLMAKLISGDDLIGLSPLGAMAKLDGRPIAIVHGDADRRLSVHYADELAAAIRANGGSIQPWIVPGADHTDAIVDATAEYERRLDAFFQGALGSPT